MVEAKWDGFVAAFHGFDPDYVAGLGPPDVERLLEDPGIIRNRRKIEATIHNAGVVVDLDAGPGFGSWLRGHGDYDDVEKALREELKFLGPQGVRQFLHEVGEDVPACVT